MTIHLRKFVWFILWNGIIVFCYPRPVLAFGYYHCLRLWVCVSVCVCQSQCVRTITHHTFKLGSPNLDQRCKTPWFRSLLFWGDDRHWPSRSNLTWKSNLTSFWACPHHNASAVQARITKFAPQTHLSTVKIPINDWTWLVLIFTFIFNLETYFSTKFICALFVLYLVRPVACKY